MIDLVWVNSALLCLGISSEVATDLPPLADHEPILTTINWGPGNLSWDLPPFWWSTLDERLFQKTLQSEQHQVTKEISALPSSPSPPQLDKLAVCITQAISTALEASTKQAYPQPSGHKWWNQDCTQVVHSLRKAVRDPDSTPEAIKEAKQAFCHVV